MMLDRCGYSTPYESTTDIDEEILESLVKTATAQPYRTEPRTRKKARYADRKSCKFYSFDDTQNNLFVIAFMG